MSEQLSLNLNIKQSASISDFSGPGWVSIIDVVRQMHVGLLTQLYLYGERDTGKTHLLNAICESFRDIDQSVIYLSLRELINANMDAMVLSSLENTTVIALDDIDEIQGHPEWQEAVFHLINLSQEYGNKIIFASRLPVKALNFELRDLLSRLARAATFQLPTGSDKLDRQLILESVLRRRHWHFDPRIIVYLLNEGPHRIGAMLAVLNELQPLFSNMERTPLNKVTKAKIQDAMNIIDNLTLNFELADFDEIEENENFLDF